MITNTHDVGHWVAHMVNGSYWPDGSRSIGLKKDGKIVAGVIYEHYNFKSIVCHIAVDGKMTPAYLGAIFDYPFNVCEVNKIICPVSSANDKSAALVEKMGFKEEGRLKDAAPDGDIVLYTLEKKDCVYLEAKYANKLRTLQ